MPVFYIFNPNNSVIICCNFHNVYRLDGKHVAFGSVISGMEVVRKMEVSNGSHDISIFTLPFGSTLPLCIL